MNEFQVFCTRTAQQDLQRIIEYIAAGSQAEARKIFTAIRQKAAGLNHLPLRGRIVPELKYHGILNYRELIRQPWRIIYKVEEDKVWVLAVIDSRRNFEDMLLDRLIGNE
jgi:toxin ParE1/3/4